ncbi:MAG: hypothetical protein HQM09_25110 [Candidatus Riflebacteria bacterium]|nr:hypothetical protein [Candidatus Riflebacteria bacterium]
MKKKAKSVKHRPVLDKKPKRNIADEPEMKELKAILSGMSTEEVQRTFEHLEGQDGQALEPVPESR